MRLRFTPLSLVATLCLWPGTLTAQQPQSCSEWQECRQLALQAAERGQYERFHDLAWRTVQTGPGNDPALMFLLARAQVLSGRPTDALVMLRRLADKGVAAGAITDPDFSGVRELPGWRQVEAALVAGANARPPAPAPPSPVPAPAAPAVARAPEPKPAAPPPPAPAPLPAPSPAPPAPRAPAAPGPAPTPPTGTTAPTPTPPAAARTAPREAAPRAGRPPATAASPTTAPAPPPPPPPPPPPFVLPFEPVAATDASQFSAPRFRPAGFAFDSVSQRFVIGDALARKLIVVGTGTKSPDDLVRADSAQFDEVAALGIDARRGDLWVASAAEAGAGSALHRLQLVSGRPLRLYRVPETLGPARLVDLAVQPSGGVVALDATGSRLLWLARGADEVSVALPLALEGAKSIAGTANENIVHVAHDGGIARVDLKAKSVTPLTGPRGLELSGFDAIRMHRDAIVGLQRSPEGQVRLVRLTLNAAGRAVRAAAVLERQVAQSDGRVLLNITGDELYYLAMTASAAGSSSETLDRQPFVIRQLTLR